MINLLNILLHLLIIFTPSVFAEDKLCYNSSNNFFQICKRNGILQSVEQSFLQHLHFPYESHFHIKDMSISSIASCAFGSLNITELSLELKNCELDLKIESFHGLKSLQVLKIISGTVPTKENLFKLLENLSHLEGSFYIKNRNFKQSLSKLENLESLTIYNTILPFITSNTFYDFAPKIKILQLINNYIIEIQTLSFLAFKKLKVLNIVNDDLLNLQPGAFAGLISLENLTISQQKLTTIKKNTFVNLPKLKNLNITFNMINNIEMNSFVSLNLETLDLSNNALIIINTQSFNSLKIGMFILAGNPITLVEKNAFVGSSINYINFVNTSLREFSNNLWGLVSNHH